MCATDEKTSADEIEITPEMVEAGRESYDRARFENDPDEEDWRIGLTTIFRAMTKARLAT